MIYVKNSHLGWLFRGLAKNLGKLLFFLLTLVSSGTFAQVQFGPGAQSASYTDTRVRGYHFTSPVAFTICQVYVPNTMNSNMWHVEIVKFTNGAPPAYASTTNAFTSLFYADSVTGTNAISCNVQVASGDVIGIYGSRSASNTNANSMANSYDGTQPTTTVLGNTFTLYRSGMQFPLNNQQMHDIWSEVNANTGRIFGFYGCCPTPDKPQGPLSGSLTVCQGDTVTYTIPWDSGAVNYNWSVSAGDSILSVVGDTMVTIVIGANSTGGQICVELEDTCTWSGDTCFSYTVNQPTAPGAIAGAASVCQNGTGWYTIPYVPGIIEYDWTISNGVIVTNNDTAVLVSYSGSGLIDLCVRHRDSCAWSDTACFQINAAQSPSPAQAGPDKTICSGHRAVLAASNPTSGAGTWTQVSGPTTGAFSDASSNASTFQTSQEGTYVLRWTVSSSGCPSTYDDMVVTVNITPTANFTTQNVCEGSQVGFTDLSAGNGATIGSWLWDMDGDLVDNYIIQNPIHLYNTSGTYGVRLIVNAQGCADTIFKNVFVNPLAKIKVAGENVCLNEMVEFQNTSTISSGAIDWVYYNYGDGSPIDSGVANYAPSHLYSQPGSYTVNVSAKSDSNCVSYGQTQLEIYHLPVAKFAVDNSCQYQTAVFTDQSTVTGAQVDKWIWTFGDGTDSSALQNPEHDYDVNGFVSVVERVWSSLGCYDDTVVAIEIYPTPVTVFNFENKVCLGDLLELESVSSIAYGSIVSTNWLVADSFAYSQNPSYHYFDKVGVYPVSLTTTSNKGCSSFLQKDVPVYEVPVPDFEFSNVCARDEFQFRDSTFFNEAVKFYRWNFDDGTPIDTNVNPIHSFDTHGVYNVTLYVESYRGCNKTAEHPIEVYERIVPKFEAVPDSGCSPLNVQFIDNSKSVSKVGWTASWIYGDRLEASEDLEHVYYNASGKFQEYSVTLQVKTDDDCESEKTIDSLVYVVPQPVAMFSNLPDDLTSLTTVNPLAQFINQSRQANRYKWHFGDGEVSNDHNPTHEWKEAGDYKVTMIAKNIYQCLDSMTADVHITHANIPFIPSAFTPNGDGFNEFFFVEGLEQVTDFKMEIFDRWGNSIFTGEGLDTKWDGKNSQSVIGVIVQDGVYGYRISYILPSGDREIKDGSLTLLGVN
jgi:gliding motility-associated-like protein